MHPSSSPGWANFSILMECTQESGNCHSVCTLCFRPVALTTGWGCIKQGSLVLPIIGYSSRQETEQLRLSIWFLYFPLYKAEVGMQTFFSPQIANQQTFIINPQTPNPHPQISTKYCTTLSQNSPKSSILAQFFFYVNILI